MVKLYFTKKISRYTAIISFAILVIMLFPTIVFSQTNYYYNGSGTGVANIASWGTNVDGTGNNPTDFKTAGSIFNFTGNNGSAMVNVPASWSVTGAGSKVFITKAVNVITDTLGLAAATIFDVDSASTLTIRDTVNVTLGKLHTNSAVVYDGKVSMNILPGSYGNLTSTNDSAYKRKFAPGRVINIAGVFNPGKATYSDSSITTFNGVAPQQIPTHSYYSLFIANPLCTVDSGALVIIKSGGKLTVDTLETLLVKPGGTLEYHSTKTVALIGTLEVSTNANFNITSALTNVPAGIVWDSAANLNLGAGNASLKVLPKLNSVDTFANVIINAPGVVTPTGARLLPKTSATYTIGGNFTVTAGRVTNSNVAVANNLYVAGDVIINGGSYNISDSSTSKNSDKLTVDGDIYITAGHLFITNDTLPTLTGKGSIYAAGDLLHTGGLFGNSPMSLTTGKVFFNTPDTGGQALSTIGITNGLQNGLVRLEVTGGNEVEVISNVTTNDTLVLSLGYFTVTAGNTLTLNKGSKGYSDSSWIITDAAVDSVGKGAVRFNNLPKNVWNVLPVGNDSTYQPVMVNTTDDSTSFTVTTFNGVTKNGTTTGGAITDSSALSNMVFSTWEIDRNDKGKSAVNTVFNWDSTMEGSAFTSLPDNQISIYQNSGNGILVPIPTTAFNANDSAVTTLNTFGYFVIGKTITNSKNTITGNLISPNNKSISNVDLQLTGSDSVHLLASGNYQFTENGGGNYSIKAKKNNDVNKANGVTTLDLALIQSHILGKSIFNSPYKIIAADVNGDGKITTLDLVYIKRLILGVDTTFTNSSTKETRLWAFVDSSYTFADGSNPFPFKESISFTGLNANQISKTFIGCKLGDVNWDWNPLLSKVNTQRESIDKIKAELLQIAAERQKWIKQITNQ